DLINRFVSGHGFGRAANRSTRNWGLQPLRELVLRVTGLKPHPFSCPCSARLKSCPDTNRKDIWNRKDDMRSAAAKSPGRALIVSAAAAAFHLAAARPAAPGPLRFPVLRR